MCTIQKPMCVSIENVEDSDKEEKILAALKKANGDGKKELNIYINNTPIDKGILDKLLQKGYIVFNTVEKLVNEQKKVSGYHIVLTEKGEARIRELQNGNGG